MGKHKHLLREYYVCGFTNGQLAALYHYRDHKWMPFTKGMRAVDYLYPKGKAKALARKFGGERAGIFALRHDDKTKKE